MPLKHKRLSTTTSKAYRGTGVIIRDNSSAISSDSRSDSSDCRLIPLLTPSESEKSLHSPPLWVNSESTTSSSSSCASAKGLPSVLDDIDPNIDHECGEPARCQHLRLDFTPIEGVDDDEGLQQKCIGFWKFIENEPRLKKMMAKPTKKVVLDENINMELEKMLNLIDVNDNTENIPPPVPPPKEKSAVEWTAELPLNNLGNLASKYCPLPPPSYGFKSQRSLETNSSLSSTGWCSSLPSKHRKEAMNLESKLRGKDDTRKICAEMDEFDRKLPRTFNAPVHPPTLSTAKLQRLLPSLSCAPLSPD